MKRIAFVSVMGGFPWGGSEILWAKTAKQALCCGYEVLVVVFDWSIDQGSIRELGREGARIISRPRPSNLRVSQRIKKRLKLINLFRWIDELEQFDPSVLCINSGNTYEWLQEKMLLERLIKSKIPFIPICQLNSDQHFLDSTARDIALRYFTGAKKVIFVSEHNRLLAERQMATALTNSKVLCNPVGFSDRSQLAWPQAEKAIFASVARLQVKYKAQDILLECLGQQQWRERNWECRFYGEGPDLDYLIKLAEHYRIANRVKFFGQVKDVRNIWKECQVLVLPSHAEGTPLALLESMLMARPAVVSDVGGNAEILTEGVTGFVSEGVTKKSFGKALERAWERRGDWEEMGFNARRKATAEHDSSPELTLLKELEDISG